MLSTSICFLSVTDILTSWPPAPIQSHCFCRVQSLFGPSGNNGDLFSVCQLINTSICDFIVFACWSVQLQNCRYVAITLVSLKFMVKLKVSIYFSVQLKFYIFQCVFYNQGWLTIWHYLFLAGQNSYDLFHQVADYLVLFVSGRPEQLWPIPPTPEWLII